VGGFLLPMSRLCCVYNEVFQLTVLGYQSLDMFNVPLVSHWRKLIDLVRSELLTSVSLM
jgi:hypothetical protein